MDSSVVTVGERHPEHLQWKGVLNKAQIRGKFRAMNKISISSSENIYINKYEMSILARYINYGIR